MIGRPEAREIDSYYFTYIDQAPGDDPLALMRGQLDEALATFSGISEEKSLQRYAAGKWSIRELLNHMADTERSFAFRAFWFARGFDSPLPSFDQNMAAAAAEADRLAWARHVEDFRRVRLATVSLFEGLAPAAWMRSGTASGKHFTVRALAFLVAGHVAHHLRILNERYRNPSKRS
jgi:uncharacterized damage-inducible protein DinB